MQINSLHYSFDYLQDEGYVTPGMDHGASKVDKPQPEYIPWEKMYLVNYKSVYNWENFGSARKEKEKLFFSESQEAANHMWKVLNAYKVTKSGQAPVNLKVASLEEFERALKSLLVGVESSFLQYSEVSSLTLMYWQFASTNSSFLCKKSTKLTKGYPKLSFYFITVQKS